jgi:aryl sulfotransferase
MDRLSQTASTPSPVKVREIVDGWLLDSRVWNEFAYRDGDVVIASYARSGTTWLQQIVAQLIFAGKEVSIAHLSPWVEFVGLPRAATVGRLERQEHRRFFKTHLPVDALPVSPKAKYIYVARDGRDTIWSLHRLLTRFADRTAPTARTAPAMRSDVRECYLEWLEKDGYPFLPFFSHVQGWWDIRHLPNVHLIHFAALKADMAREIRGIAAFLDISVDPEIWPRIIKHCSFDYMKRHASELAPPAAAVLPGGSAEFFYRGTNDRWQDVLTAHESECYEAAARARLSADCAEWLAATR